MSHGDGSARIRQVIWSDFIEPQIGTGKTTVAVPVRLLMKRLESEGFPKNRPRQFCTAPQKESFLKEKGLAVDVEGPPSGTSTTAILHFRVVAPDQRASGNSPQPRRIDPDPLLELQGILKGAISEGANAFLRELRRDQPTAR